MYGGGYCPLRLLAGNNYRTDTKVASTASPTHVDSPKPETTQRFLLVVLVGYIPCDENANGCLVGVFKCESAVKIVCAKNTT